MAHAGLQGALEVVSGAVSLRPAGYVSNVGDVPGQEAARVREHSWTKASFSAAYNHGRDYSATLTLSKLLQGVRPEPQLHVLSGDTREKIREHERELTGETSEHAITPLPILIARVEERGGEIAMVACTAGATEEDYWAEDPAARAGNELVAETAITDILLPPAQRNAIHNLYEALTDASAALLGAEIETSYAG